jgi:hypothetical protein
MRPETRVKARRASEIAGELYRLLDDLRKELTNREDFAGYLLANNLHERIFGRKSDGLDVLSSLISISQMGEPLNSGEVVCAATDKATKNSSSASKNGGNRKRSKT